MIGWLNVLGVFACGFFIIKVVSRVIYGVFGGIYVCVGVGGSFRVFGHIYGVLFKGS